MERPSGCVDGPGLASATSCGMTSFAGCCVSDKVRTRNRVVSAQSVQSQCAVGKQAVRGRR